MAYKASTWRDFENFVGRIEQLIAVEGANVNINDQLRDIHGDLRQVDATVTLHNGPSKILILIECRKRKKVSDVTWIEQLITKRRLLRAAHVIVVSSQALTGPALRLADKEGIEVRTLQESNQDELPWILKEFRMERVNYQWRSLGVEMRFQPHPDLTKDSRDHFGEFVKSGGKLYVRRSTEQEFQVLETLIEAAEKQQPFPNLPPGATTGTHRIEIYSLMGHPFELDYEGKIYQMLCIIVSYSTDIKRIPATLKETARYDAEGSDLSYRARDFRIQGAKQEVEVAAVTDASGTWLKVGIGEGFFEHSPTSDDVRGRSV